MRTEAKRRPDHSVAVRPFAEPDCDAVRELWCSAWEATYPDIDFRARWPGMLERWRAMCAAGAEIHVAALDGAIAGMIVLDRKTRTLDQIAVAPALFGSSVGSALMAFAKSLAGDRLILTVNATNPRAVRFYEREGFVPIGEGVNPASGLATWIYEWNDRSVMIANNS